MPTAVAAISTHPTLRWHGEQSCFDTNLQRKLPFRPQRKRQPFETKPHFPEMWEKWGTKSFANDNASHYGFAAGFSSALAAGFGVWTFQNSGSAFTHSSRG